MKTSELGAWKNTLKKNAVGIMITEVRSFRFTVWTTEWAGRSQVQRRDFGFILHLDESLSGRILSQPVDGTIGLGF